MIFKSTKRFMIACLFYFFNHFISFIPLYGVRHAYLRYFLRIKIGKGSSVHMGCFITGNQIQIGANSVINRRCYLDGRFGIDIGDSVSISPECYLISLTHDLNASDFTAYGKRVIIDDYAWIGARCTILPGVHLSKGCVVGAGSVVTKSVSEFTIVAGIPAAKIGERNRNLNYRVNYFPFFDTDITK